MLLRIWNWPLAGIPSQDQKPTALCTRPHAHTPTRPHGDKAQKAQAGSLKALLALSFFIFALTMSAQTNQSLIFGNDSGCNLRVCPWIDDESGDCTAPTALDCWLVPNGSTLNTEFTVPTGSILCHYSVSEEGVWPQPVIIIPCTGEPGAGFGEPLCLDIFADWKMSDCGNIRVTLAP